MAKNARTSRIGGAATAVLSLFGSMVILAGAAGAEGPIAPAGGGVYEAGPRGSCLDDAQRQRIRSMLDLNIAALENAGRLPRTLGGVLLDWPLVASGGLDDPGYHGVSNFVDLDSAFPNQLLDYECGSRTYDTGGGYNHLGIDYYSWPFWWYKMDHDQVSVVAAADGMIIGKDDGEQDRSCGFGAVPWNAVYIRHSDGSEAWYGHLKNGTATTKTVGSTVVAGEYLGIVGSSGSSTNPHLHLEIRDDMGAIVEPYQGACQGDPSWWNDQRPYYDSAINLVSTHSSPPEFPPCPEQEIPHFANDFPPAATVHVAAYYRDLLAGEVTDLEMIMPDGNVWQSWTHSFTSPPDHYSGAYWFWSWNMPPAPEGLWTFEATYDGVTYSHQFRMETPIFVDGFESGDLSAW